MVSLRIALLLTCIVTFQFNSVAAPRLIDSIVTVVNNQIITLSQYRNYMQTLIQENSELGNISNSDFRKKILDKLILETLEIQSATSAGIRIDDIQFNVLLRTIAKKEGRTVIEHKKFIESQGNKWEEYLSNVRKQIIKEQAYRYMVAERINITNDEIDNYLLEFDKYENNNKQYEIRHIFLSFSGNTDGRSVAKIKNKLKTLRKKIIAGTPFARIATEYSGAPDALNGGYFGYKKASELPITYLNALVKMKAGEVSKPILGDYGYHLIKLTDVKNSSAVDFSKQYHVLHLIVRKESDKPIGLLRKLIDSLHNRLVNKENFSSLAIQFSEDIASAGRGGDIGWISLNELPIEASREIERLKKGEFSSAVETKFGFHIFKLINTREIDQTELDRRNFARNTMVKERLNEEIGNWQKTIIANAVIEYKNLESINNVLVE